MAKQAHIDITNPSNNDKQRLRKMDFKRRAKIVLNVDVDKIYRPTQDSIDKLISGFPEISEHMYGRTVSAEEFAAKDGHRRRETIQYIESDFYDIVKQGISGRTLMEGYLKLGVQWIYIIRDAAGVYRNRHGTPDNPSAVVYGSLIPPPDIGTPLDDFVEGTTVPYLTMRMLSADEKSLRGKVGGSAGMLTRRLLQRIVCTDTEKMLELCRVSGNHSLSEQKAWDTLSIERIRELAQKVVRGELYTIKFNTQVEYTNSVIMLETLINGIVNRNT